MLDQRGAIKTYALAGKTFTETFNLIKEAYGELAFGRTRVYQLHYEFKKLVTVAKMQS